MQAGISPSEALKEEAEYYYSLGIKYLRQRSYEQAAKFLRASLERVTGDAGLHYYLALAMCGNRRPKLLSLSTVQAIEKHLRTATEIDPSCGHAYLLWAIVKYDYYVLNGMFDRPPKIPQLLARVRAMDRGRLREMLLHIHLPGNIIWEEAVRYE